MKLLRPLRILKSVNVPFTRCYATAGTRKTALYDLHVKEGGKMVEFGDFLMPLMYKNQSIGDSVQWTRNKASLFDVRLLLFKLTD